MKKAFCFFMAIVFIVCVITHGKNERFSFEVMLTNITRFEDMPTISDIIDCWTSDTYYVGNSINLEWIPIRSGLYPYMEWNRGEDLLYYGKCPLAYDKNGNIDHQYDGHFSMMYVYDSMGHPYYHQFGNGIYSATNFHPVIREPLVEYESYDGDNEFLEFFDNLGNAVNLIIKMIKSVFSNVKYLLPWNNTVPRGNW